MHNFRSLQRGRQLWVVLCMAPCAALFAQETPAPSAPAAVPAPPAPSSAPRAADMPRPEQLEPAVETTPAPAPTSTTATAAAPAAAPAARPGSPARKGVDRLELETTDITGNRELPKVLYIVPWKRSDLSDLTGKPPNSLLDEVLQPIDRDVFQRENRYYDALKPDVKGAKTGAAPLSGDKP